MRQKWSHSVGGYVSRQGRNKDVGRQEREGVVNSGSAVGFEFDFNILTALKGWVGHAPQGRGALHIYRLCALQQHRRQGGVLCFTGAEHRQQ